ncbi:MAG: hypothetical protein CMH49_10300 [Myxococcales bacterium]|nr:hypothetical protein [Myxococcales bacterium]
MSLHRLFMCGAKCQDDQLITWDSSKYILNLSFVMTLIIASALFTATAFAQVPAPAAVPVSPISPTKAAPIPTAVPAPQANAPAVVNVKSVLLPGTSAHEIAELAQKDLSKLMNEGPCPCDPQQTLLQCIQAKTCPAATALAEFGVQKYKEGMGSDQVAEAVINKFIADFSPPAEFDLSKTAFKGVDNAPITVVEFADFECPHCALMAGIMSEILKERPKAIKIYFKQFPLPFHQLAPLASKATIAAHKQGAFWPMHDLIFAQQENLKESSFIEFAEQLGLNLMVFRADFASEEVSQQVESEKAEGAKAGLQGTPTLYFNGKMYRGEQSKEALLSHIDSLLSKIEVKTEISPNSKTVNQPK